MSGRPIPSLLDTAPTTPAGINAAIRYIQIQMRDDGTYMPQDVEWEYAEGNLRRLTGNDDLDQCLPPYDRRSYR